MCEKNQQFYILEKLNDCPCGKKTAQLNDMAFRHKYCNNCSLFFNSTQQRQFTNNKGCLSAIQKKTFPNVNSLTDVAFHLIANHYLSIP